MSTCHGNFLLRHRRVNQKKKALIPFLRIVEGCLRNEEVLTLPKFPYSISSLVIVVAFTAANASRKEDFINIPLSCCVSHSSQQSATFQKQWKVKIRHFHELNVQTTWVSILASETENLQGFTLWLQQLCC